VFKLHGIGGIVGSFLTGIFADSAISALDGSTLAPGAWNGEGVQVARQLADITVISAWSFTISCLILLALKHIPGMHLRVSEDAETRGLDNDQFFDEQIGDWSFFHETRPTITEGVRKDGVAMSSDNSMDREGGAPQTKKE
jgi:Amt family ammonium transporter